MKKVALILLLLLAGLFIYTSFDLPPTNDLNSPPAAHVSPRYIEMAHEETGAVNMVTAVLADYRGYDTLGETTVIFTAGISCLLILEARRKQKRNKRGGR
ncbi:MAG: multicomponent Na+:H+ antiporter subunit [Clostridia bacterium]|nr:multicomponent Na+:H+ antiporter subunit [Clostridia bacterium]